MPQFYDHLPQEVVQKSYELYENFSQNTKRDAKENAKITDVFLVSTGHGLEFVQKWSLRSIWLGFVKSVKQLVGIQDDTFSIEKNLEVAAKLIQTATNADDKYFEILANRMAKTGQKVDGQTLRRDLLELGIHLRSLKTHVENSRVLQEKNIDALKSLKITLYNPQKPQEVASKCHFASQEQFRTKLKTLLATTLTPNEIDEVASALANSHDKAKAIDGLEKAKQRRALKHEPQTQDLDGLRLALMKALSYLSSERLKTIQGVLQKLEPKRPEHAVDAQKLGKFAQVFGDAFIKDSGFEGDWTSRPYVEMVKAFIQEKLPNVEAAKELFSILDAHVDLRDYRLDGQALGSLIKQKLQQVTGDKKSCLLLGGWQEHALVYEIEKQTNGKYAFRVYNEGAGVSQHDQLEEGYKSKYHGCIAIRDIPEEQMFNESFLGCLQAYTRMPKLGLCNVSPEEFLTNHLLVMLHGTKEPIKENVKAFLSPQRSGTCPFRSLLAFLATVIPEDQYPFFKFDFKLYLLDTYLPQIKAACKAPIITTQNYEDALRQYNLLMRCCEKYANGIRKLESVIADKDLAKAEEMLLQYQVALREFQGKILQAEKTLFSFQVGKLSSPNLEFSIPTLSTFEETLRTETLRNLPFDESKQKLLQEIDACFLDGENVANLVHKLTKIDPSHYRYDKEYFYVVDRLVRKMGSIHAFDSLVFPNPRQAIADLQTLVNTIANNIEKSENLFRAELRAQYFFVCYGLEQAFKQLPQQERIVDADHTALISKHKKLSELQTSDPLYAKILEETRQLVTNRPPKQVLFREFPISNQAIMLEIDKQVHLDENLVKSLCAWWKSDQNQELRRKVDRSVAEDRSEQAREIKRIIECNKDIIARNRQYLQTLGEPPTDWNDRDLWKQNEARYKTQIEQANAAIGQAETLVKQDPKYWPEGFEETGLFSTFTDAHRAAFFIAKDAGFFAKKLGVSDILPPLFRTFCHQAILATNIFAKAQAHQQDLLQHVANAFAWDAKQRQIVRKESHSFNKISEPHEEDVYLPDINNIDAKELYKALQLERTDEPMAPRAFASFEEKVHTLTLQSDDAKEFFSLHATSEVQLEAVFSYFLEHLDKLQDSNWINIFHAFLFESDILLGQLQDVKKRELLVQTMQHFFSTSIKNAMLIDDYAQAANLVWIASNVQRYTKDTKILPNELVFELVQKAANPKYASQWPVFFEALLASRLDTLATIPTTDEQKALFAISLFAHIQYTDNPPEYTNRCQLRYEAALRAQMHLKERLSERGGLRDETIGQIVNGSLVPLLANLYPAIKGTHFTAARKYACLADDGSKLSLIAGNLFTPNVTSTLVYTKNLSVAESALLYNSGFYERTENLSHLRCTTQDGMTYVKDDKKKIVVAFKEHYDVYSMFLQTQDGKWQTFIPLKERTYSTNFELQRKYHHIQSDDKTILIDRSTLEPVFEMHPNNNKQAFYAKYVKETDKPLHVVSSPQDCSFSSFEHPACTIYLADRKNQVQKIEFTRLGLSLEKKRDTFVLAQDAQWHLAKEQVLPHFGQSTGFMILENEKGEKKAIVPLWESSTHDEQKRSLNFPYNFAFREQQEGLGRYVEFDLKDAKIVPKSIEARYYLAKIYLEKGRIDEAEQLLESVSAEMTSRKLTKEEQTLLEKIVITQYSKDVSSRTVRLKARSYALWKKNELQFGATPTEGAQQDEEVEKTQLGAKISCFHEYLNRLGHLRPITAEYEVLALESLVTEISAFMEKLLKKDVSAMSTNEQAKHVAFLNAFASVKTMFQQRIHTLTASSPLVEKAKISKESVPPSFEKIASREVPYAHAHYDPPPEVKMRYWAARKENRFPFNPLQASDADMMLYFNCLKEEVESTYFFQSANRNGLLSSLYYMCFFAHEASVRQSAQNLLHIVCSTVSSLDRITSFFWPLIPRHTIEKQTRPAKKAETSVEATLSALGLFCLEPIKASSIQANFLSDLFPHYFTKTNKAVKRIDADAIFTPNCPQAKDAATKKEFVDTVEDVKLAQNQLSDHDYQLNKGASLDVLLRTTGAQLKKESSLLAHQEQLICQTVASALTANRASHFEFLSTKRQLPNIQELCILSAKKDFINRAKALYPELSGAACEKIQETCRQYLQQKQFVQRLSRIEQNISDLLSVNKKDQAAISSLQSELARALETKSSFTLDDPLASIFLIVETTLNITLRQDQVENIRKFATASEEERPIVLQMIMGAGKTSVLQPLLAFLFATPEALSTVMVPESLLEPVRLGLSNALGSAFQQSVYTLPYNRELSTDTKYLTSYAERLEEIQKRSAVLLITPREKYSIITSLYEAYFDLTRKDTPENQARVDAICKICHILQFKEISQIDEIDSIMNPLVIFKYPIGDREVVHTERASLLSELVIACATDETISKNVSIDFAKRFQERVSGRAKEPGIGITKDLYTTVVQPQLVRIGIDLLKKHHPIFQTLFQPGYDKEGYLAHFLTKSTPFDEEIETKCLPKEEKAIIRRLPKNHAALVAFSKDLTKAPLERLVAKKQLYRKDMLSWLVKAIPNQEQRELLGVMAQGLAEILPSSLLKECGTHYGIDLIGKKYVARPYDAAGSPKPTQYSNPYEVVIHSTQLALYYGLPKEACQEILVELQNQAKVEMEKNASALADTDSYGLFLEMMQEKAKDFSFLETPIPASLVDEFQKALSKNPKWLLYFLKGRVYNQISHHSKSIFITPSTLAGCSKKPNGYTGTLDEGILAKGMRAIPEKGTDGKTINAVESKAPQVYVVKETLGKTFPDHIIQRFLQDPNRFVWTDSDGWLKDANIEDFSEKLLVACEKSHSRGDIRSIVYHNAKGTIMSLERDSLGKLLYVPLGDSKYKPEQGKSLTIIQQKYETGTNILQRPTAADDNNVRKGMSKRDALQSIFRMRKILENQRVDFPVKEDVATDIASQIIDGLLVYPQFRMMMNSEASFDPQQLDALNLEPELSKALKMAMNDVTGYRGQKMKQKEFMLIVLNAFVKYFTIDSKTLWRYFVANLSAVKLEKHWHTGRQRMREVIEGPIRKTLIDTTIPASERKKLFLLVSDLMVANEEDSPFTHMASGTEELEAQNAIEKETARYAEIWNRLKATEETLFGKRQILSPQILEALARHGYKEQPIEAILQECVDKESIPEVVEVSQSILGQELEQETEREEEEEIEREIEIERETRLPDGKRYQDLVSSTMQNGYNVTEFFAKPFASVREVLPQGVRVKHESSLFVSPNLFLDRAQIGSKTHGTYHLPGRFLLAIDEPHRPRRYLLISHEDAAKIKKGLHAQPIQPPRLLALFTFDGQVVAASDAKRAKSLQGDELHRQIVVQAKVLTGRAHFTKPEVQLLSATFESVDNKNAWSKLYENIIKYKPSCAKRYVGSHLEKMFSQSLTV